MKKIYLRSLKLLPRRDISKIIFVMVIQVFLSFLDLLGVALIGLLGALTIRGVQSLPPSGNLQRILENFDLEKFEFQDQAAILGILAASTLIFRTLLSIIFTRRTLHFLSARGAIISSNLVAKMLSRPLTDVLAQTSQQTLYALTNGVMNITLGVIGNSVAMVSDLSLLIVLLIGLLIVNPLVALCTGSLFIAVGLILYKMLHERALNLGESQAILTVESSERIVEIVQGFREAAVKNRRRFYAEQISSLRFRLSRDLAESAFLPYVSKYVLETTVIIGALAISALQFSLQDAAKAVATLSIFLAAGTRIAPAVLRLQQCAIQLKSAIGSARPTISLIEELSMIKVEESELDYSPKFEYPDFIPTISAKEITFTYPSSKTPAVQDASFEIAEGSLVALVGSSGAGKSTLADLILGLLVPEMGKVFISGIPPTSAIKKWPGAIAYVPQDVLIVNGTIRSNIALGFELGSVPEKEILRSLKVSQLEEFVSKLPKGIDTEVGERGAKLSGGQRQRLGIARALFTNPKLLILDEATSSLDGKTEASLSHAINALKGSVTVVLIAHRLSTVREADNIIYLESGRVRAIGTFEELRSSVPNFEIQARLMGL